MLVHIPKAIADSDLVLVRAAIARGTFERMAGDARADGPLRLSGPDDVLAAARGALAVALQNHPHFAAAACPSALVTPVFYRYEPGMGYADHIDPAMMGGSPTIRCDIAATVCLDDGALHEGGELVIDADGVPVRWKGQAGDCLLYPPNVLHRVENVRSGVRCVAVLWIQSLVADPERRRVLFDLVRVLELAQEQSLAGPHVEKLRRGYFNLLRSWT